MSTVIHKYELVIGFRTGLMLPEGARVVHVGSQGDHDKVVLWVALDPNLPYERSRLFHVVGTGHVWPPDVDYVGTAQSPPFVWHVLEQRK
jgi:hypothetical protein